MCILNWIILTWNGRVAIYIMNPGNVKENFALKS
jgi:hypothetical protein